MNYTPLKMRPHYQSYLWGVGRLKREYGKSTAPDITAESWELSGHPDGASAAADGEYVGKTITELGRLDRDGFWGSSCKTDHFPLMVKAMSDVQQIEYFTGFGLYDRRFVDVLRTLHDSAPFLRGVVAEYAPDHLEIPYEQQKRREGKTHNNFFTLFDAAMLSLTSYTKGSLRLATFGGFAISGISFLIALFYLVQKLLHWNQFVAGNAPILIGIFFLGGIQLSFIGLLGEYIMSINTRVMKRPLVIEEERINFDGSVKDKLR